MNDPAVALKDPGEDRLPDLMPCLEAWEKWFPAMGKNAYYGALTSGDIPAKKFGGKWFVLTRPLQRILNGEHNVA